MRGNTPVELPGSLPGLGAKAPDFRLIDEELGELTLATDAARCPAR